MTNRFEALRNVDDIERLLISPDEELVEKGVKRQKLEGGDSKNATIKEVIKICENHFQDLEEFLNSVDKELPLEREILAEVIDSPCKALFKRHLMKQVILNPNLLDEFMDVGVDRLYELYLGCSKDDFDYMAKWVSNLSPIQGLMFYSALLTEPFPHGSSKEIIEFLREVITVIPKEYAPFIPYFIRSLPKERWGELKTAFDPTFSEYRPNSYYEAFDAIRAVSPYIDIFIKQKVDLKQIGLFIINSLKGGRDTLESFKEIVYNYGADEELPAMIEGANKYLSLGYQISQNKFNLINMKILSPILKNRETVSYILQQASFADEAYLKSLVSTIISVQDQLPEKCEAIFCRLLSNFDPSKWEEVKTELSKLLIKDLYPPGKSSFITLLILSGFLHEGVDPEYIKKNFKKAQALYHSCAPIVDKLGLDTGTQWEMIEEFPGNQFLMALHLLERLPGSLETKNYQMGWKEFIEKISQLEPIWSELNLYDRRTWIDIFKDMDLDEIPELLHLTRKWFKIEKDKNLEGFLGSPLSKVPKNLRVAFLRKLLSLQSLFEHSSCESLRRLGTHFVTFYDLENRGFFENVRLTDQLLISKVMGGPLTEPQLVMALEMKRKYPKLEWAIIGVLSQGGVVGDWIVKLERLKNHPAINDMIKDVVDFLQEDPDLDVDELIEYLTNSEKWAEISEKKFPSLSLGKNPVLFFRLNSLIRDIKRINIPFEKILQGVTENEKKLILDTLDSDKRALVFRTMLNGIPDELTKEVVLKTLGLEKHILVSLASIMPPSKRVDVIKVLDRLRQKLEPINFFTIAHLQTRAPEFLKLDQSGYFLNVPLDDQFYIFNQLEKSITPEEIQKATELKKLHPKMEWILLGSLLEGVEVTPHQLAIFEKRKKLILENPMEASYRNIFRFLQFDKGVDLDQVVDICSNGKPCEERIREKFPSLFHDSDNQELLVNNIRKLLIQTKSLNIPFEAMMNGISDEDREKFISILRKDLSYKGLLFGDLIKGAPVELCLEMILGVESLCENLESDQTHSTVRRLASIMPPSKRLTIIQRALYFDVEISPDIASLINALDQSVESFEALERAGYFERVHPSVQYSILKGLEKKLTDENIKNAIIVKGKTNGFEAAIVPLVVLGVSPDDCASFLNSIGVNSFDSPFLITYLFKEKTTSLEEKITRFKNAEPHIPKNLPIIHENEEDYIEAVFDEIVKSIQTSPPQEEVKVETPFEFLPKHITLGVSHPLLSSQNLEEKKVALKVLGVDRFPHLKLFSPFFKLEMADYFLLLYKRRPLTGYVKSALPTESPKNFELQKALDPLEKDITDSKVLKNNQRVIDSILARKDVNNQWREFPPESFDEMKKLAEWVYYSIGSPKANAENRMATLNAISSSVQGHCPTDWCNEFIFQYSLIYGSDKGEELVQSFVANGSLKVVSGVIQELAKQMVGSGMMSTLRNAVMWTSDNHRRNRILVWLQPRFVPGSEGINSTTDPYLPLSLNYGQFRPSQEAVIEIFDRLNTLKFQLDDLQESVNSPLFTQQEVLRRWLEKSPLATHHNEEEWKESYAELIEEGPPNIEVHPTNLSPLFALNDTAMDSPHDIKVGRDLKNGQIKQFLVSHQTFPEFKVPIAEWLASPTSNEKREALQKVYIEYEETLKPKRMRDQLRSKMIPCRLEDEDIEAYFTNQITFDMLVERGIASAQREDFVNSLMDESGKFKREACLIMLVSAGLYEIF